MKIKRSHILISSILLLSVILLFYLFRTKGPYEIKNRTWDVCVKTDFHNPEGECNYLVSYAFHENGSFTEFTKSSKSHKHESSPEKILEWELINDVLTINAKTKDFENTIQQEVHWVDESTFYTVEENSFGVTIETFYTARN